MKEFILKNKVILAGLVVSLGIFGYVQQMPKAVVNLMVDGQLIGNTLSQTKTEQAIQEMIDVELGTSLNDLRMKSTFEYVPAKVKKENFTSNEDLLASAKNAIDYKAIGQEIKINDETFAVLNSKEDAERLLDAVRSQFLSPDEVIVSAEFVENIAITSVEVARADITSFEDAWKNFEAGKDELLTYKIAPGDTTWDIADKFDMYVSDIAVANPEIDIELLQIGQVINLNIPMAYINVRTITNETVEEAIANKVIYEKTSSMYVGESKLKKEGAYGKKVVEFERTSINGVLEDQVVLSEEVLEEPVATVILSGSKWREVASSGELIKPTSGTLTSRFGTRWGRAHEGIDIGTAVGTKVIAADDGIVTKVGYISGYGKTVILDHGNGRTTLYGHLSGYTVQVGQSVKKGTQIAKSGATGSVTGPCLHFEVRENGVPKDPLKYIIVK